MSEQAPEQMSGKGPAGIKIENQPAETALSSWAPLALGFRPFFLLGIYFATLLMLGSLAGFVADLRLPGYFPLSIWHAHEMVFGYAVAVIAGFLLTSVRNWTGLDTPSGRALALLALLWLAPRLLYFTGILPPPVFALLDLSFLPVLAIVLGRLILKAGQTHNYPIPLLLLLLSLCNAATHMDALGLAADLFSPAMQIAVVMILALIVVIAGRVLPFFMQGAIGVRPEASPVLEKLALPSVLLFALALASAQAWLIVSCALFAGFIHSWRLLGWMDGAVWRQPILRILHAGYAWLAAGFLLYALAELTGLPTAHAIHAWTLGAIGMFTTGMMARVALGHSGRRIEALPWIPVAFGLVLLATLVRVLLPSILPAFMEEAVLISATCWILAFSIIALRYTSILLRARADGKPG